jgi:uncharacterized repeat protein (TIGR01451 family)
MASRFLRSLSAVFPALLLATGFLPTPILARPDVEVSKTVDNPLPAPGQPVEFTVLARNVGDGIASSVTVVDLLPSEMRIPTGMAAWVSSGHFDASTNTWALSSLEPGRTHTLVLPAVVVASNPPACLANVAQSNSPDDTNSSNNRGVAAVRQSGVERCVDVAVSFGVVETPFCGARKRSLKFIVTVRNLGPDEARNVYVDLSQAPAIAPDLHFVDQNCRGTRCTLAVLARGEAVTLNVASGDFTNDVSQTLTFQLSASASDVDYATANNQATASLQLPPFRTCEDVVYSGGGGCFIATAAYGSPLEPHVQALRQFRDRYLARTAPGRAFIQFYYRHSPSLAAVVAAHPTLRFAARTVLTPLVLTVTYPWRVLALTLFSIAALLAWRRLAPRAGA